MCVPGIVLTAYKSTAVIHCQREWKKGKSWRRCGDDDRSNNIAWPHETALPAACSLLGLKVVIKLGSGVQVGNYLRCWTRAGCSFASQCYLFYRCWLVLVRMDGTHARRQHGVCRLLCPRYHCVARTAVAVREQNTNPEPLEGPFLTNTHKSQDSYTKKRDIFRESSYLSAGVRTFWIVRVCVFFSTFSIKKWLWGFLTKKCECVCVLFFKSWQNCKMPERIR